MERSSDLPSSSTTSCSHTQEAAKQGEKVPKGIVCYEKTKHKKRRNGDFNISHKCQTVRRLQSTPTSATLSPSLPPLFFSHSKPKPKKQATVDYSPPLLCLMLKKEKLAVTSRPSQQSQNITRTEANCLQENQGKNNSLARSLARSCATAPTKHARTHAQSETRTETNARDGNWESRSSRVRVTGFCRLAFWANVTVEMRAEFCWGQGQGQRGTCSRINGWADVIRNGLGWTASMMRR